MYSSVQAARNARTWKNVPAIISRPDVLSLVSKFQCCLFEIIYSLHNRCESGTNLPRMKAIVPDNNQFVRPPSGWRVFSLVDCLLCGELEHLECDGAETGNHQSTRNGVQVHSLYFSQQLVVSKPLHRAVRSYLVNHDTCRGWLRRGPVSGR